MTTSVPAPADLTIRDIDVRDDPALRAYHRVHQAAFGHGRSHFEPMTFDEFVVPLRRDEPNVLRELVGAWAGDELVGAAVVFGSRVDNLDHAWFFVFVDPPHRRRGVGRALTAEGLRRLAEHGRHVVASEVEVDGAVSLDEARDLTGVVFARSVGFTVDAREVRRELALPADPARLAALDAQAARGPAEGRYRVEVIEGMPATDDLAGIVELENLVEVDAPSGTREMEPRRETADSTARRYRSRLDGGERVATVVARDAAGAVVGLSRQSTVARPEAAVVQEETYVRRDHRGHGLGAAMKAASIRWWMANAPEKTTVRTCNADDNAHMVAINDAAGFEPVGTLVELVRRG